MKTRNKGPNQPQFGGLHVLANHNYFGLKALDNVLTSSNSFDGPVGIHSANHKSEEHEFVHKNSLR